jgi:hypothetical protein
MTPLEVAQFIRLRIFIDVCPVVVSAVDVFVLSFRWRYNLLKDMSEIKSVILFRHFELHDQPNVIYLI